jgi:peptidoglycan/LPS O-acetylase OafA/YrhL
MDRPRRPDIDWLRVFATYLLFVFHAGMVFNPAPFFHIRNADLSFTFLVLCGFISLWHMPLFFFLAGWSAFSSLEARGTSAFARERLLRLGVPLLAGCVLIAPFLKFFELRSGLDLSHTGLRVAAPLQDGFRVVIPGGLPEAPPFEESFFTFLSTFFTQLDRFTWGHLWFVAYLLTLTMVYLPVFTWLRRRRDRFEPARGWIVYLPIVPLAVVQLTMRSRWPGIYNLYNDWANVAYYSVFVIGGFLLACQPALEKVVARECKRSLAIGVATTTVLLLAVLGVVSSPAVLLVGSAVAGWCFVVAFVGLARRFLTATSSTLGYLSESAFPVYILHQAAIVVPGYFLIRLPLGIAAKFVVLVVVALALTLVVYHWLVRPFRIPRFLLGMRPRPPEVGYPTRAARPVATALYDGTRP